jgi:hypothetical protein
MSARITKSQNPETYVITLTSETSYAVPPYGSRDGVVFKNASAEECTLTCPSGTTIDGNASIALAGYAAVELIKGETEWNVIRGYAVAGAGAVDSVNGATGVVVLDTGDISEAADANYVTDAHLTALDGLTAALALKAPLASPTLTGVPLAPTVAGTADDSTKIATTAFVQAVVAANPGSGNVNAAAALTADFLVAGDGSNDAKITGLAVTGASLDGLEATDIVADSLEFTSLVGTVPVANGGTGLTALGAATKVLRVNAAANALEYAPNLFTMSISFNPKAVCDGTIDRLFLMKVGAGFPNGIKITEWYCSFDADPATEADLDLKRADAFIGVANAAVMDVLDTTNGASSETTAANINADTAVANGKVIYLEFGTAYATDNLQINFQMSGYAV